MSSHKSTKKDAAKVAFSDSDSLLRFAETLKLRSLAVSTQEEYMRYVRKLAARVKQSIKCFNQPVSYKNPLAKALPVTYVAFVPKDKSAEERAKTDKNWQRAVSRGWTIRTFPGTHVAMVENPRGIASLMEAVVGDANQPVASEPSTTAAK
jgi:hypothetical protein